MKKILGIMVLGLLLSGNAYSHEVVVDEKMVEHEPYKCKLPEDRNYMEKQFCKMQAEQHRMCKLDEICALIKIEELEKENKELKEKLDN
tara:strand:+ start:159 stop:425 length:267 start_codon:yes stop_codon:yes gene_type:complete